MKEKNNLTESICSIIFSIVSIFIFWWLAAVGLGLGIRVLVNMKSEKGKEKIFAIIGIIMSVISLVIFFVTHMIK